MEDNKLSIIIRDSQVETSTGINILKEFTPLYEKIQEWEGKSKDLIVNDVSQVREMQMARQARLALKDIRVSADKTRKKLKEDSNRYNNAVQAVYNTIESLIKPIEDHLQKQEDYPKILKEKLKAELRVQREAQISPYQDFVYGNIDLGDLSEEDFDKIFRGAKLQHEEKIALEKAKAKEEELKAKAKAKEDERIRKENERLKKERLIIEEQLKKERQRAEEERIANEKILEAERAERARAEAEATAKAKAEQKLAEEKLERERQRAEEAEKETLALKQAEEIRDRELKKVLAAPYKEQILFFARGLEVLEYPIIDPETFPQHYKFVEDLKLKMQTIIKYIRNEVPSM